MTISQSSRHAMAQQGASTTDLTAAGSNIPEPGEWHFALLRLAGSLPDGQITIARDLLSRQDQLAVAQTVVAAAVAAHSPVPENEAKVILAELAAAGQSVDPAFGLLRWTSEQPPVPSTFWIFSSMDMDDLPDDREIPVLVDLTDDRDGPVHLDLFDRAAVDAMIGEPVLGLWRAWRYPFGQPVGRPPRRVFVVLTEPGIVDDELPQITGRLQNALIAAGEADPQVEVHPTGYRAPEYQDTARTNSALLWTSEPRTEFKLARVFDLMDPLEGPAFTADHPTIEDEDERFRMIAYLDQGTLVVEGITTLMDDVVSSELLDAVPMSFRTDGTWIWTDASRYYLATHHLSPESALVAYLQTVSATLQPVSEVGLHRAMVFLEDFPDEDQDEQAEEDQSD